MKRGDRFLHRHWLRTDIPESDYKRLPRKETAVECIVTRVAQGVVYYRPVDGGTSYYSKIGSVPVLEEA